MLLIVRTFLALMHLVMLCQPGKSFLFSIRDCAEDMKSGSGMGCLFLMPGVKDQELEMESWRSVPCRGRDIDDWRNRTHLESGWIQLMVGN